MATEVLDVVDTREYELRADRWVPIPGSGDARPCYQCGRPYEVHATVRYDDGRVAIVGTGCMGLGHDVAHRYATKATTIARMRAELSGKRVALAAAEQIETQIAALVPPDVVEGPATKAWHSRGVYRCGDAEVGLGLVRTQADLLERRASVVAFWRDNRRHELTGHLSSRVPYLAQEIQAIEIRLSRASVGTRREPASS